MGLDLFFPSQMQENLKVKGACGGVGVCKQSWVRACKGCESAQMWLGVLVCVQRGVHGD